jgi:CDP-diacylglycerol--serine O-phosphatidyltransferase
MAIAYASRSAALQHALANALTIGNFAAGVTATLLRRHSPTRRATWILVGAACDSLDGTFARRAGRATEAGARADGFADVITCGIAPAVLLQRVAERSESGLVRAAPSIYLAGIAFRVVKNGFPARTSHLNEGLPVTGAGIVVAVGAQFRLSERGMAYLTAATVAAMLSRVTVPSGEAIIRRRHVRAQGYRV